MSETGENSPPTAPEEQPQPSQEAESAASGTSRQHNSDSWVIVDSPESKPAETYVKLLDRDQVADGLFLLACKNVISSVVCRSYYIQLKQIATPG